MSIFTSSLRRAALATLAAAIALGPAPLAAQDIQTIDPDEGLTIDGDLQGESTAPAYPEPSFEPPRNETVQASPQVDYAQPQEIDPSYAQPQQQAQASSPTYKEDDLIGAAEGVFGKGAEGLARLIEDVLDKQGEPNGYIVGREGGGAFVLGVRYGSGTLYHKVEGQMPVYWTGPSIGFDIGANAANTFVLVYNLHDTEELYERYPAGEGDAYIVGGLTASYLRKGDVVLIPIRVGAGLRLGINAGYMKFSKKQRWLPF